MLPHHGDSLKERQEKRRPWTEGKHSSPTGKEGLLNPQRLFNQCVQTRGGHRAHHFTEFHALQI